MSITTRRLGRILLSYFLRGLLVLVPITITVWAIWNVFVFLDTIIETKIPGAGILLLLAIITVAGWLASTLLFKPLAELADETLHRVPFLKTLYGTLKDLVEAVVAVKAHFQSPLPYQEAVPCASLERFPTTASAVSGDFFPAGMGF